MKALFLRLISVVLASIMLFSAVTASAAERNTGKVKYLSEVAIIEASSDEEADKILEALKEEKNGAFVGKIALDLNVGGGKKVYMAYKTSTNVDDAITDLAVMNMKGDYKMGDYEQLLNQTIDNYGSVTKDYRIMATEFKANYEAKSPKALTAYRQMNYYYLEENGKKTFMGDYMLNFPEKDDSFSQLLFRGNLNIVVNLRTLLSMGVGDLDKSFAKRIEEAYAAKESDPTLYISAEYEDAAASMLEDLKEMKSDINNYDAEIAKLKDKDLPEDVKEFSILTLDDSLKYSNSFLTLLKEIPKGDTTLGDFIMDAVVLTPEDLYPIIAAATPAEAKLLKYHSFYTTLLYDVLEKDHAELEEAMLEFEEHFEPISVYYGVQNDLTTGSIGITGKGESFSNSTGKKFYEIYSNGSNQGAAIGYTAMGVGGFISTLSGIGYLIHKSSQVTAQRIPLQEALNKAISDREKYKNAIEEYILKQGQPEYLNAEEAVKKQITNDLANSWRKFGKAKEEVLDCTYKLDATGLTKGQIFLGSFLIVMGIISMGVSIWQLVEIYNEYKKEYTDIPDNMVDVVSYKNYGDRFINYKNVPSYYYKDGKLTSRENDLNAYDGLQWVSMYYTKNYEAGPCLTATPDLIATESQRSGYTSIHLFGHSSNYNLNSYCNRKNAEPVYLAFKYSTNQKSADTYIPDVIGSSFNSGAIAISGFVGLGLGLGIMGFIKRKKPEDKEAEALN